MRKDFSTWLSKFWKMIENANQFFIIDIEYVEIFYLQFKSNPSHIEFMVEK